MNVVSLDQERGTRRPPIQPRWPKPCPCCGWAGDDTPMTAAQRAAAERRQAALALRALAWQDPRDGALRYLHETSHRLSDTGHADVDDRELVAA